MQHDQVQAGGTLDWCCGVSGARMHVGKAVCSRVLQSRRGLSCVAPWWRHPPAATLQ